MYVIGDGREMEEAAADDGVVASDVLDPSAV